MWFTQLPFVIQLLIVIFSGVGFFSLIGVIIFAIYKRVKIKVSLKEGVEIDPEDAPK